MRVDVDRLEYTNIFSSVFVFCRILIEEHYTFLFNLLSYKLLKFISVICYLTIQFLGEVKSVNSIFGLPFDGMNSFLLFYMTQVDLIKLVHT